MRYVTVGCVHGDGCNGCRGVRKCMVVAIGCAWSLRMGGFGQAGLAVSGNRDVLSIYAQRHSSCSSGINAECSMKVL